MRKRILAFVLTALMCMYSALPLSISAQAIDPVTAVYVACSLGHLAIDAYRLWREEHPNTPDSAYPGYNPGGSVSRVAGGTTIRDDGGSSSSGTWGDDPTPTPVDFESAYQEYTKTLPAQQVNSNNTLIWTVPWKWTGWQMGTSYQVYSEGDYPTENWGDKNRYNCRPFQQYFTDYPGMEKYFTLDVSSASVILQPVPDEHRESEPTISAGSVWVDYSATVPVAGYYTLQAEPFFYKSFADKNGSLSEETKNWVAGQRTYYVATSTIHQRLSVNCGGNNAVRFLYVALYPPVYLVEPYDITTVNVSSTSNNSTYNVNTRAASITGDYGIIIAIHKKVRHIQLS